MFITNQITNKMNCLNNRVLVNILLKKYFSKQLWKNKLLCSCSGQHTSRNYSSETQKTSLLPKGPTLKEFITASNVTQIIHNEAENIPYLNGIQFGLKRKVFFDIYGCQMNFNDTEIIWSILKNNGYLKTDNIRNADIVLVVTCAIREGAESKIWNKIEHLKGVRNSRKRSGDRVQMKIGILGCMAERLKQKLLEKEQAIDLVAGPDSYKDLPRLLALTENNQKAVNVLLSLDETYADIIPVRLNQNSVSAFVSIMRGCDNMCTYCIVPFTRGRERSRPVESIVNEVEKLVEQGVREVTLLGQNVNSYRDISHQQSLSNVTSLAKGFRTVYKQKKGGLRFADLLEKVANIDPELRVRFTSPHPKDFPDEVLELIRDYPNICKNLHLPAQSGNSEVLERMRRGYTREAYLELVDHIRSILPSVSLSSDFICGFCGETEEQFQDTISLMKQVQYNTAYLFPYSMREKTTAHRRYVDDVPQEIKQRRLEEMINVFRTGAEILNKSQIGKQQLVLVEGESKRSSQHLVGRNDNNIKVIFPKLEIPTLDNPASEMGIKAGDYITVTINAANSQVLKGTALYHTTLQQYNNNNNVNKLYVNNFIEK